MTGMALAYVQGTDLQVTISGIVQDANGQPAAGAIVQVQGFPDQSIADESGRFSINAPVNGEPLSVTAWAPGHYIGWTVLDPAASDWSNRENIVIAMRALPHGDNSEFEWYSFEGVEGSPACGVCHREYTEWKEDQHSRAAINHRFLNVYMGTNVEGETGQPVVYGMDGVPLPPDPAQPFHGPGFRLDNPNRAGNCATCHTPIASKAPNTQNCTWSGCHTDLTTERSNGLIGRPAIPSTYLRGDAAEGISCEFCHKISAVHLDPETGLPFPDMPGILSVTLNRPATQEQDVFFGTLVDVTRPDSYLPLLSKSEFCAGCHFGVFGGVVGMGEVKDGTVIYNSYGEWLESPYSDPVTGKTCQQCHMPESDANWFVFPERGGLVRDYAELNNHTMRGASDVTLLQNAVTMETVATRVGDELELVVEITNDQTGHHVPTDAPIRSLILLVSVTDVNGSPLIKVEGPENPAFAGDYAGYPGKTFAKVLRDDLTGEMPTAAFWRPVTIVEDTRIAAFATDSTRFLFSLAEGETVNVTVQLIYRRAFYDLMQQKGWNDPDIIMEENNFQFVPK